MTDRSWRLSCSGFVVGVGLIALAVGATTDRPAAVVKQVVVVVVDTLRADRLGMYGHDRATSPRLDGWAGSGRVYEQGLATSPWTLPSFASIYTGHPVMRHGAGLDDDLYVPIDETVPTLAELLAAAGFATGAVIDNPLLTPGFGVDRGFQTYDYVAGNNKEIRRADTMVDRALDWVFARSHEPFFLLLHIFDPHVNYDAPPPYRGLFTTGFEAGQTLPFNRLEDIRRRVWVPDPAEREFISRAYDEEIAFVDAELGRFLDRLKETGFFDHGLVVLTADHGEELFDHGGFEHGHAMWQELLHVPFVVWGGGVVPGREPAAVSLIDVAPTVLDYAGVAGGETMAGVSLWPNLVSGAPLPERALYAESKLYGAEQKVIFRWPHKLVLTPQTKRRWMVDLDQDPGETLDIVTLEQRTADRMARELEAAVEAHAGAIESRKTRELDPETLEKLKALGYID